MSDLTLDVGNGLIRCEHTVGKINRICEKVTYKFVSPFSLAAYNTNCWREKNCLIEQGYGNPGRVSFQLGLHFLCHAQLFAELGKSR